MAKILIVEDDRATAQMLSIFIKALGHEAQIANDGAVALKIATTQPQDIIISDVEMAVLDGITFTMKLRELDNQTPVLLCSGNTNVETVTRARAAGANDFLTKPLKLEEIRRAIDRVITAAFAQPAPVVAKPAPAPVNAPKPNFGGNKITLARPERLSAPAPTVTTTPPIDVANGNALASELVAFLPGDFYADSRRKLVKLAERSRALIDAEPGMLGQDFFEVIHTYSSGQDGALVIHHLGKEPLEDVMGGLLTDDGKLGTWFQRAKGGTLVVLEIEKFPMVLQAQLNLALRSFVGDRLIVTVGTDPDKLIADGLLDEGLYFRFASCVLRLPPVRECEAQIPDLYKAAVAASSSYVFGSVELQVEEPVARALRSYNWPENVTELRTAAGWTAARLRSPQITMAQLPERFFKARMPTMEEALQSAQMVHVKRAMRIYQNPLEAAEALKISVHEVESAAAGDPKPVFRMGTAPVLVEATASRPAQPTARAVDIASLNILLIVADPILRAAAAGSLPARGLRITAALHGLEGLTLLAAQPESYGCALIAGDDGLFSGAELVGQARRLAPKTRLAALADNLRAETPVDFLAQPPRSISDLEEAITRLLLLGP